MPSNLARRVVSAVTCRPNSREQIFDHSLASSSNRRSTRATFPVRTFCLWRRSISNSRCSSFRGHTSTPIHRQARSKSDRTIRSTSRLASTATSPTSSALVSPSAAISATSRTVRRLSPVSRRWRAIRKSTRSGSSAVATCCSTTASRTSRRSWSGRDRATTFPDTPAAASSSASSTPALISATRPFARPTARRGF